LQYVKYAKLINIAKGIAMFCDKMCFGTNENTQQNKKISNIKTLAEAGSVHNARGGPI